ncbi:MAG: hypothetical protein ACKO2A_12280, partial [Acidimicrobiaceae bacterium]
MSDLNFNENSSQLPPPQLPVQPEVPSQDYDQAGRSPRRRFGAVLVAAVFGLFGGIIGTYIAQDANLVDLNNSDSTTQITSAPVVVADEDGSSSGSLIAQVAERLANSVVTISTTVSD